MDITEKMKKLKRGRRNKTTQDRDDDDDDENSKKIQPEKENPAKYFRPRHSAKPKKLSLDDQK